MRQIYLLVNVNVSVASVRTRGAVRVPGRTAGRSACAAPRRSSRTDRFSLHSLSAFYNYLVFTWELIISDPTIVIL